jgi:hypothetical protein
MRGMLATHTEPESCSYTSVDRSLALAASNAIEKMKKLVLVRSFPAYRETVFAMTPPSLRAYTTPATAALFAAPIRSRAESSWLSRLASQLAVGCDRCTHQP